MKQELSKFQLAAIGAVALAYSELELAIDTLLSAVAGLINNADNRAISISVTDANTNAIIEPLANAGLEPEDQTQLKQSLAAFRDFKIYRDLINHVRLINLMSGEIANSEPNSVSPFSDKALNIFYDHLIALEKELSSAAMLAKSISLFSPRQPVDLGRATYLEGKRAFTSQFRGYGTRRHALPPMPWLPSESDLIDVKVKWNQVQDAELMAWLTAWPDVGSTSDSGVQG